MPTFVERPRWICVRHAGTMTVPVGRSERPQRRDVQVFSERLLVIAQANPARGTTSRRSTSQGPIVKKLCACHCTAPSYRREGASNSTGWDPVPGERRRGILEQIEGVDTEPGRGIRLTD